MILRLSQKLNKKIKTGTLASLPRDDNPYADWSSHIFTADRTQYIILSNTTSLYSCVMYGRGITGDGEFIERALSTIREFMEDDGQAFVYRRFIAPDSAEITFATSLNRSVIGSINELIHHATMCLVEDQISPHDVGFSLNELLLSALATEKSRGYGKPNEAFKLLADGSGMCDDHSDA